MVFLGSREDIAHLGYVRGRCPRCGNEGMLSVYEARRKLTLVVVVAVPMNEQLLVECSACNSRFGVSPEQRDYVISNLVTADQLASQAANGRPLAPTTAGPATPVGRNLYQILQVDPDADPDVIEAAFKRLALKFHPDTSRASDAPARMREIIEARDVLADPQRRQLYDRSMGIVRTVRLPEAMRSADV